VKNTIKIITILGIVISFFSVYSMEKHPSYIVATSALEGLNLSSDMRKFGIFRPHVTNTPANNNKSLVLHSIIMQALQQSNNNKEIVKKIYDAVSQGIPLSSNHKIISRPFCSFFYILPNSDSVSVFETIQDYLKRSDYSDKSGTYKKLMSAIFQGEAKRKEQSTDMYNKLTAYTRDQLKIKVSKDIVNLILSHLQKYNVSEKRTALIEQAEQEFHEEQQS